MVAKTVFGYWERSARRQQIQIAEAARAPEMTTGKGQMFSNTLFLKIAVRNDNQNMRANLIPQRKTQNATSSHKIRNAADDSRSKQRSSSTTRGMRGRTSVPNSRRRVERTETKQPGGATGVNICTATQVQQKNAPQFTSSSKAGGQALGAHFATGGLEPVPVDASTGSTKQEKTGKHNRVPNANRKTNKSTTWAWYGNATGRGKTTVQGHELRRCCS